eukprot:942582-Ditylum_brightwellii.AAC.1
MEKDYSAPKGERIMKEKDANNANLSSDLLISMTKEVQIKFLISLIKQFYDANVKCAFSISIDASKVVEMIQLLLKCQLVIGSAAPDHCSSFPENDDNDRSMLQVILDSFEGDKPTCKKVAEIKVALIVFQQSPENLAPM